MGAIFMGGSIRMAWVWEGATYVDKVSGFLLRVRVPWILSHRPLCHHLGGGEGGFYYQVYR